jgi:hypothetical protein
MFNSTDNIDPSTLAPSVEDTEEEDKWVQNEDGSWDIVYPSS